MNTFARTIETQADLYSLETENRPDALASALVKTAEYRYPRPTGSKSSSSMIILGRTAHTRGNGVEGDSSATASQIGEPFTPLTACLERRAI